jgi:VanZ family protein
MFRCKIIRFWRTLAVLVVIMTLCLVPSGELNRIDLLNFNYEDLVVHLVMFIAFSTLLYFDFHRNIGLKHKSDLISAWVMVLSLLLGITTETLQYLFASLNRSASFSDLLFDFLGASLGITYMRFIRR